ncbi:methyl-accepting chemotaxis protein [Accumulibacter sp.]|uniref:methyl-accepting chemotaxis protein n=1 Tax=Accumulibacter sp. TaxID=2053492 RepID=UPI0025FEF72B|nr:methyl-accepting chemotaxis protein [Accumulibacter sp.]MCM8626377.1 methyl-accepting chemotaxis protein [Accumulibacter sp.]
MKGILNLLARARLVELSDDERPDPRAESQAGDAPGPFAVPPVQPERLPAPADRQLAAAATQQASLPETGEDLVGQAFTEIYAAAGVPPSPYPAEKLLRLLDGLRAMDAATRRTAILAMDEADDNWQIGDCLRDADLKIAALAEHKRLLAGQLGNREAQSAELVEQIGRTLEAASEAIRQQIAELQQLLEREVTRAAQERSRVEAGLRAAREAAERETRRVDAEIERLREIPNTFSAAGAAN